MKKVTKAATLETLATVMKQGFERQDKTIETLATMMANRFDQQDKRLDDFKKETADNFQKIRGEILRQNDRFVTKDTFDKYVSKFPVVASKVKGKVK